MDFTYYSEIIEWEKTNNHALQKKIDIIEEFDTIHLIRLT